MKQEKIHVISILIIIGWITLLFIQNSLRLIFPSINSETDLHDVVVKFMVIFFIGNVSGIHLRKHYIIFSFQFIINHVVNSLVMTIMRDNQWKGMLLLTKYFDSTLQCSLHLSKRDLKGSLNHGIFLRLITVQVSNQSMIHEERILQVFRSISRIVFPILFNITYLFTASSLLLGYLLYFSNLDEQEGKKMIIRSMFIFILLATFFNPIITASYQYFNLEPLDVASNFKINSSNSELLIFLTSLAWTVNLLLFLASFFSLISFFFYLASYLVQPNKQKANNILKSAMGVLLIIYPLSWQFPIFPTL